jgi:flagellar hook assembly protein FlgD
MQFQLLNSFQGVSLERIHPDFLTQDKKNWHSASESSGFGTPGYKNSQYSQFQNNDADILIEPEVFSPDNDGRNDILNIRYKFSNPGYVASVTIFDSRGRKVKGLVTSEMLGTEGYFTWDGLNDANQKASIGIYVIYIEIFNLDGKTSRYKKTCVLASHLD